MSVFRQPYERHDHKGGLDSGLVYYLLNKYGKEGHIWLEQFHGGRTAERIAKQLGIAWETVDIRSGEDARHLAWPSSAFDGVLSHPPYWTAKKYSDDPRDLSGIPTYPKFLRELCLSLDEAERVLSGGGWLIVIVGDVRKDRVLIPLHSDVIQHMSQKKNMVLRDIVLWELTATGTPMKSTKWMIMTNYCMVWEKIGHDVGGMFE